MERVWKVGAGGGDPVEEIEALRELLLTQRGVEGSDLESFFNPRYDRDVHDPLLLGDMKSAVERVYLAIRKKENVVVYGDYDVDGVSSTALMTYVLRELGAEVVPFLPHRLDHGYGLNKSVFESLVDDVGLVITVDCGISNAAEVEYLMEHDVDVIVSDHHTLPNILPKATAILHPQHPSGKYPFEWLCGAGVSWKFASALLRDSRSGHEDALMAEKLLLDLACLGTVADMVPLVGENRVIVRFGLEILRRTKRPGLKVLLQELSGSDGTINERLIGYRIGPLLNAAGRMEHPQTALDLLLAESEEEAREYFLKLQRMNRDRQSVSRSVLAEATGQAEEEAPIIFAYNESWPAGVLGLVAGRLADKFARPAVVVGGGKDHAVGSARAPEGSNMFDLLSANANKLVKFGGHAAAAGFSVAIDGIEQLQEGLLESAGKQLSGEVVKEEGADTVIDPVLFTWSTVDMLERMAPFGEQNKRPVLIAKNLWLVDWRGVGKDQAHAKFTFRVDEEVIDGIGFSLSEQLSETGIKSGDRVDVLFQLEINEYRGNNSLQLNVRDVVKSGTIKIIHI